MPVITDDNEKTDLQVALRQEAMAQKHIFIAAPFFTPREIETVERIENVLDQAGVRYFSPMREPPNPLKPDDMQREETREAVNRMCCDGLRSSIAVLAWLDRIGHDGDEVLLVHRPDLQSNPYNASDRPVMRGGVVKQRNMVRPDEGVLWECGYAAGLSIPVVGFTLRDRQDMNAMLGQNLMGIAQGWQALDDLAHAFGHMNPLRKILELIDRWEDR